MRSACSPRGMRTVPVSTISSSEPMLRACAGAAIPPATATQATTTVTLAIAPKPGGLAGLARQVDDLELARLQLARDAGVDLRLLGRRLTIEHPGALHLELPEALELEDLQHQHEVQAGDQRGDREADHRKAPAHVEVAVVVRIRDE